MKHSKQSILVGGFIASAGIFISKLISLLYISPYYSILQTTTNTGYYASAYTIYSYILNIATAGLPFAIATLIARYIGRNDYRACLLIKKIALWTMASFGFFCMTTMILFSNLIAKQTTISGENIEIMRNVIVLISLAVFVIPILSSLRGFYQGLRELEVYSKSQVIEQVSRVVFLLVLSVILVFVFKLDAVFALYVGVISASVSGIVTIIYIRNKTKKTFIELKVQSDEQREPSNTDPYALFKELIGVSIPFLIIAIFGYSDAIINQWDFIPGMKAFGVVLPKTIELYREGIFAKASKLIAIPMILAPGFSAAIIPYITGSLEKRDYKKVKQYIIDCIESVLYLAVPICFGLFVFAKPIIYVLFGDTKEVLDFQVNILQWFSIEAFCATISPVFSTLVMSIGYRKKIIRNTIFFSLIKIISNRMLISIFGMPGMVISSFLAYFVFTILNILIIKHSYDIKFKYTLRKCLFILLGILGFYLVAQSFYFFEILSVNDSRIITCLILMFSVSACFIVYLVITGLFKIPQTIFKIDVKNIVEKIRNKRRR